MFCQDMRLTYTICVLHQQAGAAGPLLGAGPQMGAGQLATGQAIPATARIRMSGITNLT